YVFSYIYSDNPFRTNLKFFYIIMLLKKKARKGPVWSRNRKAPRPKGGLHRGNTEIQANPSLSDKLMECSSANMPIMQECPGITNAPDIPASY
ncbi:MAG: hypothetical protein VB060_13320, partial [Oscillibacter sp.]